MRKDPVLTDETGAFEFTGLPAGSYVLNINRGSYPLVQYPEPGRLLRNRFTPLVLREGQVLEDLTVPVYRGGVIAGRVLDVRGDPLEGAQVQVMWVPRNGRPAMRNTVSTNDLGEFRASSLPPGRYIVRVQGPRDLDYNDPRVVQQPVPTFFPGVLTIEQAQPITVRRAETTGGIDITVLEATPTVVTGVVLAADGSLVGPNANVQARPANAEFIGGFGESGGMVKQDGAFRLQLAPGDYVIEAQARPQMKPNQPWRPEMEQFGGVRVGVAGSAIEGVTILLGRGATASGRIVFEGDTPPPTPPKGEEVRSPPMFNPDGGNCRTGQPVIAPDWTFKVDGLWGKCALAPFSVLGRWSVKSVTYRGQNIMEDVVQFEQGQSYDDLQIVVTDKRSQVDFHVTDETGKATREYVAVLFPANKARWSEPSRVRTFSPQTVADVAGQPAQVQPPNANAVRGSGPPERLMMVPPGEYFAVAVENIDTDDSRDPRTFEKLVSSAVRVTVTLDAPVELALQRVKLEDVIR